MNNRNGNGHPPSADAIDRLPPHSIESERGVLGSIILDPIEALSACITRIGQDHAAFYDLRHQTIYGAMVEMFDAQEAIDLITLPEWLRFQGQLDAIGGLQYLAGLPDATPSAANVSYYLDTVMSHYRSRKLVSICTEAVAGVYDSTEESDVLVDRASQNLFDLASGNVTDEEVGMHELVMGAIATIEDAYHHEGIVTGVATGFADFDKMTTGLHAGEMIIIAARPSMGKTSLAMNIAEHVAVDLHLPVGVFSLEMTKESLVQRMLCSRARVNARSIANGFLAERDFPRLTAAAGNLHNAPLYINDTSGLSILGLRTRARRMHRQHQIKLLVVDYLQLISADRNRNDSRQEEVRAVSAGLKGLAKELKIPVIVLSQLNRQVEQDKNRKPRLADLRESGAIEQDADLVGMLYTPRWEDEGPGDGDCTPVNLYIAKQRNGPTGDVPLNFIKYFTRFESAAKVSADDQPPQEYPQEQQQEFVTP